MSTDAGPLSLAGKTIWVTGGAGYLGSAIVAELDRQCERVLCIDLPGKADAFVREKNLARTLPLARDLSSPDGLAAWFEQTTATHGAPDGLVHLSFASSAGRVLEELSAAEFEQTFDRTLPATLELCRAAATAMQARGGGSVVLFASMYGVVAPDPRIYLAPLTPNPIDYGASKAALLQMMRYLAVHYGPAGVRFNCVTPGPFPNPAIQRQQPDFIRALSGKTALQRIGQNNEIVAPTLFLLGDGASFVTGHSLAVDGGWTAW